MLERAAVTGDTEIKIYFSEPLDSLSITAEVRYEADHNLGCPLDLIPVGPDFSSVRLLFDKPLHSEIIYTLTVQGRITDCAGNPVINKSSVLFTRPVAADSLDIIINEILFNPQDKGKEFLEIYNRSDKTIDLRYFNIASRDPYTGEFNSIYPVIKEYYLFFPGHYLLIAADCSNLIRQNNIVNTVCCVEPDMLPSYSEKEGVVTITDNQMNIIDELHYTDDMHFKLLGTTQGVSLERINPEWPSCDPFNWHSASEDCGFGTPGHKNSQYHDHETANKRLLVEPEVFSPDNDGYNDFISISYNFNAPGSIANVTIFDSMGRIVRRLVKNTLLGTCGVFIWDGIDEYHRKSGAGIYLIYTEVFDLQGNIYKFKNTCVLAVRVN